MIKDVNKTVKNRVREYKGGFLSMFLGTLASRLLGNLLTGKGVKAKIPRQGVTKAGEGTIKAAQDF